MHGKFANTMGNVAIVDCSSIAPQLSADLYNLTDYIPLRYFYIIPVIQVAALFVKNTDFCKYGMSIEGLLESAIDYYVIDDANQMKQAIIKRGRDLMDQLAINTNATLTTPMLDSLKQVEQIRVFLSSSLSTIVFFLAILSIQLIYSLMLSDVEEKTYQYGMLRALGFRNKNLIGLISLQSFSFSVPGLIGGLVVAYFLNVIARAIIFSYAENTTNYNLSLGAIILGVCLGTLLPLISNILPIQRALSKNLRESLDMYHRSVNELTVSIKRLEEMGFSLNQTIIAVMLVLLGGITYYVGPLSWIYGNYSLFFFVINFILIMMIMGLAFISILLLPYI